MQIIENLQVKEKLYTEKLENGLNIMIIPKKGIKKKYVMWATHYGSMDNKFVVPGEDKETEVPDGVAHFLEHKMFEQPNGTNSLDTLTALGVNANAYTTTNHTAYLFESTDNFYEALDELMDYVQHPYFTDQNVEKEKGIIGQEIMMYDDYPDWAVYMNALKCMYKNNAITIDIAGSIDSIAKIDKDVLYKCYNTFYNPSNMVMGFCGDFEPEELIKEIIGNVYVSGDQKQKYLEDLSLYMEKVKKARCSIKSLDLNDLEDLLDESFHLNVSLMLGGVSALFGFIIPFLPRLFRFFKESYILTITVIMICLVLVIFYLIFLNKGKKQHK